MMIILDDDDDADYDDDDDDDDGDDGVSGDCIQRDWAPARHKVQSSGEELHQKLFSWRCLITLENCCHEDEDVEQR